MTINRDDIDRRIVDFSEVASGRCLPLVHPGEILRDEFLIPMGISVYGSPRRSRCLGLGPMTLCSDVVRSRRTLPSASGATSACRRNSGSICRRATISTLPTAP